MSVDAPIKKNNHKLPRTTNDVVKAEKKKLIYAPTILKKARESIRVRTEQAIEFIKTELFAVVQSITENVDPLYHSSKSDILKRFPTFNYESGTDSKTNYSAIIIYLSVFTKSHAINENTFLEFSDSLRKRILNESSSCLRCDVMMERYFKNSLKQNIRSTRGLSSRKHFNDEDSWRL